MKPETKEAIDAYVKEGVMPRPFVWAVICDSIKGAIMNADGDDLEELGEVWHYVFDTADGITGTWERATAWIKEKEMERDDAHN